MDKVISLNAYFSQLLTSPCSSSPFQKTPAGSEKKKTTTYYDPLVPFQNWYLLLKTAI